MLDNDNDNDSDNDNNKNKVKTVTYRLKFIDSNRFMQDSLSNLVDNLSKINNKKLDNARSTNASLFKSIDYYRFMQDSLSNLVSCLSRINNDKLTDNIRSVTKSLMQSIDSCRFMQDELRNIVNNKTPYVTIIEKFPNTYQLYNKELNKFKLLLRKGDIGYNLEVYVEYPRNLHKLHSDLPFLPERMKINNCTKLVCNLNDKENYPIHILALKQALNHGLKLKKVDSVIEFR